MLANCAAWIAEECDHYGIPITRLSASQAQAGTPGVAGHNELGAMGGGHWDPGPDFPWDRVLDMARGGSPHPTPPEDAMAIAVGPNADGRLAVFVEKDNGEVVHCEQGKPNGEWWKNPDGSYKWLTMGNPSK
jgi:hypothetical protein